MVMLCQRHAEGPSDQETTLHEGVFWFSMQQYTPQYLDSSADDILDGKDPVIQEPTFLLAQS